MKLPRKRTEMACKVFIQQSPCYYDIFQSILDYHRKCKSQIRICQIDYCVRLNGGRDFFSSALVGRMKKKLQSKQ